MQWESSRDLGKEISKSSLKAQSNLVIEDPEPKQHFGKQKDCPTTYRTSLLVHQYWTLWVKIDVFAKDIVLCS